MRPLLLLTTLTFILSCKTSTKKNDPDKWYKQMKDFILVESNLPADSSSIEYYVAGQKHKIKYYHKGFITTEKWYRESGEQVLEIHYSNDQQFELRKEIICESGQVSFEGVFYRKYSYGLSTWWNCDNQKESEGIRYRDNRIGVWKTFDKNGDSTLTDYKKYNLIDSLQLIKKFDD